MAIFYVNLMRNECIDISIWGERNYKLFLDILKRELDKMGCTDITPIQTMILLNIGDGVVTIGEVIGRGYYIGSNASYNVKKLIKNGYMEQVPSDFDRRSVFLKLTIKGLNLCENLENILDVHMAEFDKFQRKRYDMKTCIEFLKSVERFWVGILQR